MQQQPQFPFGYGLSYTSFAYSQAEAVGQKGQVKLSVMVKNTGSTVGEEVIQAYVSSPLAGNGDPYQSLKAFKRIKLNPGEQKEVSFELDADDFAQFDEQGNKTIRKGSHTLWVGGCSPGKRAAALNKAPIAVDGIVAKKYFKLK